MSKEQYFEILLSKYLRGEVSEEERAQFMKLIQSSDFDEIIQQNITDNLELEGEDEGLDKVAVDRILKRILSEDIEHTVTAESEIAIDKLPSSKIIAIKKWISVAAAVLVLFGASWYFLAPGKPKVAAVKMLSLKVEQNGSRRFIRLPDGSTAILNKGSEVSYPATFAGKTREVNMTGEVYFDIHKDAKHPFIIHSNKVNIRVLGTAFNVRSYVTEPSTVVTVTRGKVQVGTGNKILGTLFKNDQLEVDVKNEKALQRNVDLKKALDWQNQALVLDNKSLEEIASIIEEDYNVKVVFTNANIKNCRITASFVNGEEVGQVLQILSSFLNTEYKWVSPNSVLIDGKGCGN